MNEIVKERMTKLQDLGLIYDGQYFKQHQDGRWGLNIHWTELVYLEEDQFDKLLKDVEFIVTNGTTKGLKRWRLKEFGLR